MNANNQQWQALINEQKESGLSVVAFCRNRNIKTDNFYYYRGKSVKKTKSSVFVRAQSVKTQPEVNNDKRAFTLQCGQSQLYLPVDVSTVWLASLLKALS